MGLLVAILSLLIAGVVALTLSVRALIGRRSRRRALAGMVLSLVLLVLSLLLLTGLTPCGNVPYERSPLVEGYPVPQGGPNDIRSILVTKDGFLVATGGGILRYEYADGPPRMAREYTVDDGLPSDNCWILKEDADGGIWTAGEGGIAYLPEGAEVWRRFGADDGLPAGTVGDLVLSADRTRVWVSTRKGLATARVKALDWKLYAKENLWRLFVHPSEDVVWCHQLYPHPCCCERPFLVLEFDLAKKAWSTVPETWKLDPCSYTPTYYWEKGRVLWLGGGMDPPLLYDRKAGTARTWPEEPNWLRMGPNRLVTYCDCFGQMEPFGDGSGNMWFATNVGIWEYQIATDEWTSHPRTRSPGVGQPVLALDRENTTIYWACEGTIAAYDVSRDRWIPLWNVGNAFLRDETPESLHMSPDGKYLWYFAGEAVYVGNPADKDIVTLSDRDVPGLSRARWVRFDTGNRTALIATPRGVVCADYAGKVTSVLRNSACPISLPVERLVFAPDGSEVWCLMGNTIVRRGPERGRAAVFHPPHRRMDGGPGSPDQSDAA